MSRYTTKTPTQIVAERTKALEAAKAREAKALASQNPQVASLYSIMDNVRKDIATASRQLVGPQSFANRRQGFELRLAEIAAGEALVTAQDTYDRATLEYYKGAAQTFSNRVAAGEVLTQADVDSVIANQPNATVDLPALQEAFNVAHAASKAFIAAKKAEPTVATPATTEAAANG
jgi:hypothetical protein